MARFNIALIGADNVVASSLMGAMDFFTYANDFWRYLNPDITTPLFEAKIYSADGNAQLHCSNGIIVPAIPTTMLPECDAIMLMPGYAYRDKSLEQYLMSVSSSFLWLKQAQQQGKWLVSHCSGVFWLAASGVLDDRKATTCWWMKDVFSKRFPATQLTLDEVVITDDNIITGGATTSYFNTCMRLLENMLGAEFSTQLSKLLLLDRQRLSQQAFYDPNLVIYQKDALIEKVQLWMQQHYAEHLALEQICEQFAVTKRTLFRRFKRATGETPLAYLQQLRVSKAKELLQLTNLAVERIVEKVGYEDSASFRKLFINHTQLTPKAYRQRFAYSPPKFAT